MRKGFRKEIPHGTRNAYYQHKWHGEALCGLCQQWKDARWSSKHKSVCGTEGGYQRHLRHGEPPCDACRVAKRITSKKSRDRLKGTKVKPETKYCADCKQTLPATRFSAANSTKDGLRANCLDCYAIEHFHYRLRRKVNSVGHPPRGCQICGSAFVLNFVPGGTAARPRYDHNHTTNLFRGWLCSQCNSGLGLFGDNPRIVELAFKYLTSTSYSPTRPVIS